MIKLFYAPGTCALAPHIVLAWIGEPYEHLDRFYHHWREDEAVQRAMQQQHIH